MERCTYQDTCKVYDSLSDTCKFNYDLETCVRKLKLDYLFKCTLLNDSQKATLKLYLDSDRIDGEAFSKLNNVKKNITEHVQSGKNLYIHSNIPGNGKTSWAVKLMQAYIYSIWPESKLECKALFINVPKFLIELKANISKHSDYIDFINDNVQKADLVVWDDIGTKVASEFEHEHLLSLIDSRLLDNKANIFTSNIEPDSLSNFMGGRLASRIINRSTTIEFRGKDKRGLNVDKEAY